MHMSGHASMNRIFRTVWNQALGAMVAVAEIATSSGGRTACTSASPVVRRAEDSDPPLRLLSLSILVALMASPAHAQSLPTGGAAVHGGATFSTSQPNRLTVTTTNGAGSNHSAINWNSFSIGSGSTTNFVQPSSSSTSINRVVTNTPSQLFGTLSSNGKLVLVNQSGIAVGAGAVVDTAGFTASALAMSQADAIAGRLRFGGGSSANLTVDGNIIARGGDVVLIAPNVDVAKTAVVESKGGSVVLAAGQSVEVTGRGLEGITLHVQAPADQAINLGTLKGDAVGIFAGTLRHSGMIQAVQANMEGGKVVLRAVGDAYVEGQGQINAASVVGKGGSVDVLGNRVAIAGQGLIDVSGQQGGGNIRVGGDFQGKNAAVQNANMTYLGPDATLKADAVASGDGGRVIVWADQQTQGYGSISARGGAQSGNGGFVEVSGKKYLAFDALVNTLAPNGTIGNLLLDPQQIDVVKTGSVTGLSQLSPFTAFGGVLTVSSNLISASSTSVTLQATQDINFNDPVAMTFPGAGLTAQAGGFVNVNQAISTNGGDVRLSARDASSPGPAAAFGAVVVNAPINTNGGKLTLESTGVNSGANLQGVVINANLNTTDPSGLTGGALLLQTAGGHIVQTSASAIKSIGTTTILAGPSPAAAGDITLTSAANDFSTVSLVGNNLDLVALNDLTVLVPSGYTTGGNVNFQAAGTLTPPPTPINTSGLVQLSSGTSLLTGASITGGSTVTLEGVGGVAITAPITAATLNINVTGSTGSGVTQAGGVTVKVTGTTTINAPNQDIDLRRPGNEFNDFAADAVFIRVLETDAIVLNNINAPSLFDLNAGGAITQKPGTTVVGTVNLDTTFGPITLLNPGNLIPSLAINASNSPVSILNSDTDPMVLGAINAASFNLEANAGVAASAPMQSFAGPFAIKTTGPGANIVLSGGSTTVTSATKIDLIAAGSLDVSGVSLQATAGDLTLVAGTNPSANTPLLLASGTGFTIGGGGRWLTYLTDPSAGHNFGPFDPLTTASFRQVGATFGTPSGTPAVANANGSLWTDSGFVSGTLGGTATKVFSGATDTSISLANATFTPTSTYLFGETGGQLTATTGILSPDGNVGSTLVTVPPGALTGVVDSGGGVTYGYFHGTLSGNIGNVTPAVVTVSPISLFGTRAYDGTIIVNASIFSLSGLQGGDTLSLSGFGLLSDKNVGTNKAVNLNTLALGNGTGLASNYTFSGGTFVATITPAPLGGSLNVTASNKVYDGLTTATLTASTSGLTGLFPGDSVTVGGLSGDFSDRHVGAGKAVTVNGVSLGGADAGNYTFTGSANATTADITQRPVSTWSGAGGNTQWSNPANWDALPDRNNVAAVSIPAGAGQVTFDAGVDPTTLRSLTSGQTLAMTGGSLAVNADLNLPGFLQTGGTLKGAGGLNVSNNFNQTGGSLQFARDVSINHASGNLVVGDIAARRVELKAPTGNISQTAGLDTSTLVAESATGMALTSSTNKITSVQLTNTGAGNISLVNTGALDIAGLRNADGDVTVVNAGATNTSGLVNVPKGDVNITANSPLRIGNDGIAAGGNVTLIASNVTSLGNMVIDGPIASGGAVSMSAGNNFIQNAAIFGADGVTASAQGAFSYGPLAFTSRAPVTYTSNGVRVVPPPDPRAVTRSESPQVVVAFLEQFGRAQRRQILDTLEINADGTPVKRRDRDAVQTEGNVCVR